MRKVAVVFGGKSCENEISVLTGVFALNILNREKYTPIPIYVHTDGNLYTSPKMNDLKIFKQNRICDFTRIFIDEGTVYALNAVKRKIKPLVKLDCAINCCHGGLGEGGGVSAMMAWNGVPLASPDLTASGVFLDKCLTKVVMRGLGVPTIDYIRVNEEDYQKRGAFLLKRISSRLKYPVVVKPAHLGSSIGISVARTEEEVKRSMEECFALDYRLIIEKYLENKRDVNCAAYALNGEIFVSESEEAFGEGIYSFEEKYIKRASDGTLGKNEKRDFTKKEGGRYALSAELREKIRAYTRTVYKRMNLKGVVRMDFLVSEGKAYLCEVNTVPGSLAYYLFCERISDARTFFGDLIEEAIRDDEKKRKEIITTGILKTAPLRRK